MKDLNKLKIILTVRFEINCANRPKDVEHKRRAALATDTQGNLSLKVGNIVY